MRTPLAAAALVAGLAVGSSALAQTPPPAPKPHPDAPKPAAPSAPAAPPAAPASSSAAPVPPPTAAPPVAPAAASPPAAEPPPATTGSPAPSAPAPLPTTAASPPSTEHAPLPAAEPTPAPMLAVNVPIEKGKDTAPAAPAAAEEPSAWLDGHALGIEAMFRGGSRLGAPSVTADSEERAGFGFDLGTWLRLAPEYAFGLALHRASLGSIAFTSGQTTVNARYATTALELGGRAYPFRSEGGELFVGLRVGLAWQDVDAKGLTPSVNLEPARPFSCSDSGGPGFALGAEVGGALRVSRAFWLTGTGGADGYHLSGDPIGNCVLGVGSTTSISIGAGLLYAFDIGRDAKLAAAPRSRAF